MRSFSYRMERPPSFRLHILALIAVSFWNTAAAGQSPEPTKSTTTAAPVASTRPRPSMLPAPAQNQSTVVPPLAVVLKQASSRAPQVRLGVAALEVSRTSYVNARRPSLANPYVEILGQRGSGGTTQGVNWNGTLWLPFELSGQRGRRIAEAEAFEDVFEASLDNAEASALGEAIAAYGAAQVAGERVLVLEQIVAMSRRTAEMYEERLAAGDVILRDATIARVDLARNQVLLQDARGRLAIALADLNRLTGARYDHVEPADLSPPLQVETYLQRATDDRPPAVATSEAEAKYFAAQRERIAREAVGPFSLMLMGGQGDFGEARLGAGLAYEIPLLRSGQGEKARADAERLRAQTDASVRQTQIDRRLQGLAQQFRQDQRATEVLTDVALPAADEAVEAAIATLQAGKDDWFIVLLSRRDQAMLRLQRLDLLERQWSLLGEMVQLTGELP